MHSFIMIKACIFDLDGVIVDTAKYHYLAWRSLAQELGFEFTEAHNEALKGVSRMTSLDILLSVGGMKERFTPAEKEIMATAKNIRYLEYILQMTPDEILPGVERFLEALRTREIKTALGSASRNARTILERVGLFDRFDAVVDGSMVENAKPDPQVFLLGAQLLGVSPADCVVFEDAEAGIEAARRAGMRSVGVGGSPLLAAATMQLLTFEGFTLEQLMAID